VLLTAILISVVGLAIVAGMTWLMLRVNRAEQRKIERIREESEARGEKPWTSYLPYLDRGL
jgi:hypothetical protein